MEWNFSIDENDDDGRQTQVSTQINSNNKYIDNNNNIEYHESFS